ncbi:hypothetical protein SLEP1_g31295 [Rubroshorea leprosula]|uniref:LysM domain-containing protein n=1 Tax=Rubroshorea leprosula TaxID=152421 RepID=A0AAV5K9M9_9ROSI|nr:hypothetical protein SLEP1_g31295 [Rubroshorea leprosula]
MERERRHTIAIGECSYGYRNNDHKAALDRERSPSLPASSFPSPGFIEHKVSKLDTLAGVAIKYGVEVADIKKMNGLATDLQMFALKSLQIPLPGRHPPSACLSNGSESQGGSVHKDQNVLLVIGPEGFLGCPLILENC